MFELGETSDYEHNNIAQLALSYKFEQIYLIGLNFQKTNIQSDSIKKFDNRLDFEDYVKSNLSYTDNILIKGSHGMRLDLLEKIL